MNSLNFAVNSPDLGMNSPNLDMNSPNRDMNSSNHPMNSSKHMQILADCINCDLCVPECPTGAIDMGAEHCQVNPALCTLCEGYYLKPRCQSVCPVDALIVVNIEQVLYVPN